MSIDPDKSQIEADKRLFPFLYQEDPNKGIFEMFDTYTTPKDTYLAPEVKESNERKDTTTKEKTEDSVYGSTKKVNVSDPCPCGSGEKFKRCHGKTKLLRKKFNATIRAKKGKGSKK